MRNESSALVNERKYHFDTFKKVVLIILTFPSAHFTFQMQNEWIAAVILQKVQKHTVTHDYTDLTIQTIDV